MISKSFNCLLVVACIVSSAYAQTVITPTNATSSTNADAGRTIGKTIDGSALTNVSDPASVLDDYHSYLTDTYWLSASSSVSSGTEQLTFDLGGTYDVDRVHYWLYTRTGTRNLKTFDISYSTDGGSTFSTPVSAASLGMADWSIGPSDRSASNVETRTLSTLSGVTNIRFSNLQNHGDASYFVMAELRFGGQEVGTPAGPVNAGTSTVTASPTVVIADGTSISTITVTLRDAVGTAVSGENVTLANTSGPGSPVISPSSTRTTNSGGVATFTVSSGTVGNEVFTATSATDSVVITQTASVDFQAAQEVGPVDAGNSTVVASPTSVPANGSTTSTITVTLRDASGLAVAGEGVSLENTSGPGAPTIVPIDIQSTDANGQATFTVSSSTPGTEAFTATAITASVIITQTASVAFTEVAANQLVVLLPSPVAANTSATNFNAGSGVENLYDTTILLDFIGTTTNSGGAFIASAKDSDGYAGDSVKSHTVVYDLGDTLTFNGFVHAQRHESDFSSVGSIDFWVTNTNPGTDFTTIANTWFGTAPHASKALDRDDRNLHEYVFDGAKLTGRYVVMRWKCYEQATDTGNPGGYTFLLGQTAAVSDYDNWSAAYPGVGLPHGDDDLDGLTNEMERLFGLNPLDASSANHFSSAFNPAAGTLSYKRRAQALTDITYKVWYSTNLSEWFWESGATESIGAPANNIETVNVTLNPALLEEPKLFIRLSGEDLGPPPVISSLWGSNSNITMNFSEVMDGSAAIPANYSVQQDGGAWIPVTGALLSGDGKTVTLTLASPLGIGSSFTVTTNRIANAVGQPLGNGTAGQFQTWDNDPDGIKVFILAGQSNMVGYGRSEAGNGGPGGKGSLRYLATNNSAYPEYDYTSLLQDPGQPATSAWATRSKVKLWWRNGQSGSLGGPVGMGDLGPTFGKDTGMFGPEYAFGQVLGDHYASDDILIIKAAWGGHKLATDFRPPSAVAARGGQVGASYLEMFEDAREVLLNLGTVFPEWSGRGYQIVGFAWHQGTSDKTPVERAIEYKLSLPDLITDVRAEFGKPDLPFVIATTGMSDVGPVEPYPYTGYHDVEKAQLWVAGVAKPDNVLTDDTRGYWETVADSPYNQGYHWNHNARSYFRVGKGLGDNMVELLSP